MELDWVKEKCDRLRAQAKPDIPVGTPPEFGGAEQGYWSPEQLYVASIATCLMSTFLYFAERSRLQLKDGTMPRTERGLCFTNVSVHTEVQFDETPEPEVLARLVASTKKYCPISCAAGFNVQYDVELIGEAG